MAAAKKSKAPKRVGKKQYTLLHFEVEGYEGEFVAPQQSILAMPKVSMGMQEGDFRPLYEILKEHDEGTAEAFTEMDLDDQQAFFAAWSAAEGTDAKKS